MSKLSGDPPEKALGELESYNEDRLYVMFRKCTIERFEKGLGPDVDELRSNKVIRVDDVQKLELYDARQQEVFQDNVKLFIEMIDKELVTKKRFSECKKRRNMQLHTWASALVWISYVYCCSEDEGGCYFPLVTSKQKGYRQVSLPKAGSVYLHKIAAYLNPSSKNGSFLEGSHLCHTPQCCRVSHVRLEPKLLNTSRKACKKDINVCEHTDYPCRAPVLLPSQIDKIVGRESRASLEREVEEDGIIWKPSKTNSLNVPVLKTEPNADEEPGNDDAW